MEAFDVDMLPCSFWSLYRKGLGSILSSNYCFSIIYVLFRGCLGHLVCVKLVDLFYSQLVLAYSFLVRGPKVKK